MGQRGIGWWKAICGPPATLAMFKRGLPMGAQVLHGGSQAYANYADGVHTGAAGLPLEVALEGANL